MVGSSIINMFFASRLFRRSSAPRGFLNRRRCSAHPNRSGQLVRLAVSLCRGHARMAAATDDPLVALASHALGFVREGAVVGLGSGRAARAFVQALAARIREGM